MERSEYIQKRRKKYLAQVMDYFDQQIVPLLRDDADAEVVNEFKGLVRAKLNALAVDAADVMALDGQVNAYAEEVKDGLFSGRPVTARS